jgi:hypothetical protein
MNRTSWVIGLIATAFGCSESSSMGPDDTSNGTSGTSETTTMSTTMSTTTMSTTTMSTTTTTGDTTTETTDDPTTSVDTSTGSAACDEAMSRCVAEVPTDWSGPVAIRNTLVVHEAPGCAGTYPGFVLDTHVDLQAGAAHTCECTCGAPQGVECSEATLIGDNNANCGSPLGTVFVGEDCTNLAPSLDIAANSYWRATATIEAGSCTATLDDNIGPVTFEDRLTLCEAEPAPGQCAAGETCMPLPGDETDGRICVWQAGDHECPSEAWTLRTLTHQAIDDDRGCTDCSCADLEGECDGAVLLIETSDCSGAAALSGIGVGSGCTQGASSTIARGATINGSLAPVETECVATNSMATGSAVAADPVTVCCLPPV